MSAASQLGIQSLAIAVAIAWTGVCTYMLIKLLDALIGVRVSTEAEREGLDLAAHGERAYDIT